MRAGTEQPKGVGVLETRGDGRPEREMRKKIGENWERKARWEMGERVCRMEREVCEV